MKRLVLSLGLAAMLAACAPTSSAAPLEPCCPQYEDMRPVRHHLSDRRAITRLRLGFADTFGRYPAIMRTEKLDVYDRVTLGYGPVRVGALLTDGIVVRVWKETP